MTDTFAELSVIFESEEYNELLETVPNVQRLLPEFFSGVPSFVGTSITLNNAKKKITERLSQGQKFQGKTTTIKRHFQTANETETLFTGVIDSFSIGESVSIGLRNIDFDFLSQTFPFDKLDTDRFPLALDSNVPIPWGMGKASKVPTPLVMQIDANAGTSTRRIPNYSYMLGKGKVATTSAYRENRAVTEYRYGATTSVSEEYNDNADDVRDDTQRVTLDSRHQADDKFYNGAIIEFLHGEATGIWSIIRDYDSAANQVYFAMTNYLIPSGTPYIIREHSVVPYIVDTATNEPVSPIDRRTASPRTAEYVHNQTEYGNGGTELGYYAKIRPPLAGIIVRDAPTNVPFTTGAFTVNMRIRVPMLEGANLQWFYPALFEKVSLADDGVPNVIDMQCYIYADSSDVWKIDLWHNDWSVLIGTVNLSTNNFRAGDVADIKITFSTTSVDVYLNETNIASFGGITFVDTTAGTWVYAIGGTPTTEGLTGVDHVDWRQTSLDIFEVRVWQKVTNFTEDTMKTPLVGNEADLLYWTDFREGATLEDYSVAYFNIPQRDLNGNLYDRSSMAFDCIYPKERRSPAVALRDILTDAGKNVIDADEGEIYFEDYFHERGVRSLEYHKPEIGWNYTSKIIGGTPTLKRRLYVVPEHGGASVWDDSLFGEAFGVESKVGFLTPDVVANDLFSGIQENLTTHTPDVGAGWVQRINTTTSSILETDGSGNARISASELDVGILYTNTTQLGSINQSVQVVFSDVESGDVESRFVLVLRYIDTNNFYGVGISGSAEGSKRLYLTKKVSGVDTIIARSAPIYSASGKTFSFAAIGSRLIVVLGGDIVFDVVDNDLIELSETGFGQGDLLDDGEADLPHVDTSWAITSYEVTSTPNDYIIEFSYADYYAGGDETIGIAYRIVDENNMYYLAKGDENITLHRKSAGTWVSLGGVLQTNQAHDIHSGIRIIVNGSNHQIWGYDDNRTVNTDRSQWVKLLDITDATHTRGSIAIRGGRNAFETDDSDEIHRRDVISSLRIRDIADAQLAGFQLAKVRQEQELTGLWADGVVATEKNLIDTVSQLCIIGRMRPEVDDNGNYFPVLDERQTTVYGNFEEDRNIVGWDKIIFRQLSSTWKDLKIKFRKDFNKGEFRIESQNAIPANVQGTTKSEVLEFDLLFEKLVANKVASYLIEKHIARHETLVVRLGHEARNRDLLDLISISIPQIGVTGIYQIIGKQYTNDVYQLTLAKYDTTILENDRDLLYIDFRDEYNDSAIGLGAELGSNAFARPRDPKGDDIADFSNTPPSAVTGLGLVWSQIVSNVSATAQLTWNNPATNFEEVIVRYKKSADTLFNEGIRVRGEQVEIPALESGTNYDFQVQSVNRFGLLGGIAQLLAQTVAGDTSAPNTPSTPSVLQKRYRTILWETSAPQQPDNTFHWQVRNSSNTVLFEVENGGNGISYTDNNLSQITIKARVREKDASGNVSGWSADASQTTQIADTIDIVNDAITTPKVDDRAITDGKRQLVDSDSFSSSLTGTTIGNVDVDQFLTTHSLGSIPIVSSRFSLSFANYEVPTFQITTLSTTQANTKFTFMVSSGGSVPATRAYSANHYYW